MSMTEADADGEKDYAGGVNERFEPTDNQRAVLDVIRGEYQTSPARIRENTQLKKQRINEALDSLQDAGWVEKRAHGLYRVIYDGVDYVGQEIVHVEPEEIDP